MTSKTRFVAISSLVVVVIGLGAALVSNYSGSAPGPFSRRIGPEELLYVPRNAALVAYMDVRAVMASDLKRRLQRAWPSQEDGRQELQRQTGINIETDIDHVVACVEPGPSAATSSGLALARGRFDETKIESLMREHGAQVELYKNKRLIVAVQAPTPFALSFLRSGVVAVGHAPLVRRTIDLANGGDNITSNADAMKIISTLDSGTSWVVGRFDTLRSAAELPVQLNQLSAVTWFSVLGRVDTGVDGVIRAETRDEESASQLRDVVRGFMALAKVQAGSKPELQQMVQSFELTGAGKTMALTFSVPAQVFDLASPTGGPRQEGPRTH